MKPSHNMKIACVVMSFFVIGSARAQQQKITPEMVVSLKTVSAVAIDPAGKSVAYLLRSPRSAEEETGNAFTELFVIPAGGGEARQFTYRPNNVNSPQWAPDAKWIYFLSRRKESDEHNEVFRIPSDGGEAEQVTKSNNDVQQYLLSPDGKWIAYTMTEVQSEADKKAEKFGTDVQ